MSKQFQGITQRPVTILPAAQIERLKIADEKKEIAAMRGDDDGPTMFDDNPYFQKFHKLAREMRRKEPERFTSDFDAEVALAKMRPFLYESCWSKTWQGVFVGAVADLEDAEGKTLDLAYAEVASTCPAAAKSISLSHCRRY